MTRRLIVISLDAVGSEDLSYMETLPHFRNFLSSAAGCAHVESVYPSLTYPAHTSIVTGLYPSRHGIVNNLRMQPERREADWFWQRSYIRATTLYDQASKAGLKCSALLWPVTAQAHIDYNLPEIWPHRPWQNQVFVSLANGSWLYQMDLYGRFGHMVQGREQPQLDNFVQEALLHTIDRYRPHLILSHFTDVDANRHRYGVKSHEAQAALIRHDQRLGRLLELLDSIGWKENTNVVILGDHYQKDVRYALSLNAWFRRLGWLTVKKDKVMAWKVIARECGGSCYIYVRDRNMRSQVDQWLREKLDDPYGGIQAIIPAQEARRRGADPACYCMAEAKEGYYFENGYDQAVKPAKAAHGRYEAVHGYDPLDPSYHTFFMASGPAFMPGARVGHMRLVDEGPLLARTLGLDLGRTDGMAAAALLRA